MKAGTFNISATEAESYWSPGVESKSQDAFRPHRLGFLSISGAIILPKAKLFVKL
jgi:hypothetical protein